MLGQIGKRQHKEIIAGDRGEQQAVLGQIPHGFAEALTQAVSFIAVVGKQHTGRNAGERFPAGEIAQGYCGHTAIAGPVPVDNVCLHRGKHCRNRSLGEIGQRGLRLRRREVAAHDVHTDLKCLVVGPVAHDFSGFLRIGHRQFGDQVLHFGNAHLDRPVESRQPAPRDRLGFLIRSEPFRQVEVGELPVLEVVEQFRIAFDPTGEPRGGAEDFDDGLEGVGARSGDRAVVPAPVVDLRVEVLAPLIDQRIHLLEPAFRPQHEIHHVTVGSRQLRRFIGAADLQQRIVAARHRMMVRMPLHVEEHPVAELPVGVPGMARLHLFPTAVRQAHAAQTIVLEIVADLHGKNAGEAQEGKHQNRPNAAHPEHQSIPEHEAQAVAPERIAVVPHGQTATRQAFAGSLPGIGEVACNFLGEVPPETLALGGGSHIMRRADLGMVDIQMFRRVLRIGGGGKEEFTEPPFPGRTAMNQLVTDDEYRLCFHGQNDYQEHLFPDGERVRDKNLPHTEDEGRRPQERPGPHRQIVPAQAAFRRPQRIHVAAVDTHRLVERSGDTHVEECRQEPPSAVDRGEKNQRKDAKRQVMRKGVQDRRLDMLRDIGLV